MNLLDRFENELEPLVRGKGTLHGGLQRCASYAGAARAIAVLADELELKRLVLAARPEFDELRGELIQRLGEARVELDTSGRAARDYEAFCAGIGGADVLVAESASVALLTPGTEAPALSLLPHTHIVVAPASRLVPRIHDALLQLRDDGGRRSRTLTFITGPSRTADIEKILVLPAHGPAQLHILVIEGV